MGLNSFWEKNPIDVMNLAVGLYGKTIVNRTMHEARTYLKRLRGVDPVGFGLK